MKNPEILIATPALDGNVKVGYVRSLMSTQAMLNQHGIKHDYVTIEISDIAMARNFFAAYLLERPNFTHLLFVDSDMTFTALTVGRLIVEAKPLIGCVYPRRTIDLNRVIELAKQHDNPATVLALAHDFVVRHKPGGKVDVADGVARVAGLGMGLCLIARTVFTGMLETGKIEQHRNVGQHGLTGSLYGFFDPIIVAEGPLSEDLAFCERWSSLCGGDVWALVQDRIGHIGTMEFAVPYIERLRLGKL